MENKQDNVDEWLENTFPKTRAYQVPPEDMLWLHQRGFDPSDANNLRWVREGSPRYVLEYGRGFGWRVERQVDSKASGATEQFVGGFHRTPQAALADMWLRQNRKDDGQQQ